MKSLSFSFFVFTWVFLITVSLSPDLTAQTLNDDGSTHTINANGSNNYSGSAQDYTIPSNPNYSTLRFTLRGGDGGYAQAGTSNGNPCKRNGGEGATVEAEFLIGNGTNELLPGGDIRFIVGKRGVDQAVGGSANTAGAGGGGTAVLYRPNSGVDWIILAAAGGGGGAHQGHIFNTCIDSQKGQGGRSTENGGNGEGTGGGSGGTNGNGGDDGAGTQGGLGGDGAYSGNNGSGSGGYPDGSTSADIGAGRGGWGFGAGGSAQGGDNADAGGGGGGYSGGGGGADYDNGGGGGSYVNSTYAMSSTKTEGGLGGGNSQNGHVDYIFENTIINWTGAVSHDWHHSGNWSPARVPTSIDVVHITGGANTTYIWQFAPANARYIQVFNGGDLTLQPNATLNVHPYNTDGIANFAGTITIDNATINISPTGGNNNDGILNGNGTIVSKFGTVINIEGMDRFGISNLSGATFTNQAGSTVNIGTTSIPNGGNGVHNETGCSISNSGTLNINNTNAVGIQNSGSFTNQATGLIKIKQTSNNGIRCKEATFTNKGAIELGQSGSIGTDAIYVDPFASFNNNTGSSLSIWGSGNYGIWVTEDGLVENAGAMTIGGLGGSGSQGNAAIAMVGTFNNKPGGAIAIDQTSIVGILNGSPGYAAIFNNEGNITIGAITATGGDGIQNQGTFNNLSTGTIEIVQTGSSGIYNATGSFINEGLLKIGENGSIANAAINNGTASLSPVFSNNSCTAVIHLFNKDITDNGNSFTNSGIILKESTGGSNIETNNGLILVNAGTFTVDNGTTPVSVSGTFSGKKIWTGCNGGSAWEDPFSWYPGNIPTSTDEVVIYPVGTDPIINTAVQTKSVRVRDGGHLYNNGTLAVTDGDLDIDLGSTVEGDGQYNLSGHFTVNGGTFIAGTSTVTMTGTVDDRAIGFDPITFYNLIIDKPSDIAVRIFTVVYVNNEMIINSGDLEVVGVLSGVLYCPFLHLPAGTDLYNYGGYVLQYESTGSFWIQAGASVQGNGSYNIAGDFNVDGGTFTPGTSVVSLNGSGTQTISQGAVNFYTLEVNKPSGEVVLDAGSVTVSNELYLTLGNLNLNGTDLELTGNGTIIGENNGSYIYSTNGGVVKKTLDLNAPAAVNPGNIGINLSSAANLGSTTIERGHEAQTGSGGNSILRYFEVTPTNNAALNATLVFNYMDHELNGQVEDDLELFKSEDGGATWSLVTSTLSTPNNTLTATGQATMSRWTASTACMGTAGSTNAVCQDITVDLDATGNYNLLADEVDGGSIGACGIVSKVLDMNLLDCNMTTAPQVVTLTVLGGDGGTSSCQSMVTVRDVTAPVMVCANPSISVGIDGTVNLQPADLDGGSFDNCGMSLSMANVSANCSNVGGSFPVVLTGTDGAGLTSTCTSTVTIVDNVLPTALCKNINGYLNQQGRYKPQAVKLNNGSFDNCGIASMSVSPTILFCEDLGPQNVTLTVVDNSGNEHSCISVVTIIDNKAPKIRCPFDIVVDADPNTCDAVVNHTAVQTYDNCGGETLLQVAGIADGGTFPLGVTVNTYEVIDQQGYTAECSFTVTVNDPGGCAPSAPDFDTNHGAVGQVQDLQASPNPFSQSLNISYTLEQAGAVELGIYDLEGRLIQLLDTNWKDAGYQGISWNPEAGLPAGVYYVRLQTELGVKMERVVLAR